MSHSRAKPILYKLVAQHHSDECIFEVIEKKTHLCKKAQDILQDPILMEGFSVWDLAVINWAAASPNTFDLFMFHWNRLLKNVAFQAYPYSEQLIDQMKKRHFWHKLTIEILDNPNYSINRVEEEAAIPKTVVYKLQWNELQHDRVFMPWGEKLLYLHKAARAELQNKKIPSY